MKNQPVPSARIVVFEHERTTRETFVRALAGEEGLTCIGAGTEPPEVDDLSGDRVDVVLIGLHTTGTEAPEAVSEARRRFPEARAVVLCTYVDDEVHDATTAAGADAVLPTSVSFEELVACLRMSGDEACALAGARSSLRDDRAAARAQELGVTPRQHEVLRNLARGLSPDAVARVLQITLATCRDHIKALHRTLECTSTSELLVVSARVGLLPELCRPLR